MQNSIVIKSDLKAPLAETFINSTTTDKFN